jgi:hypothetical protein
MLENGHGKSPQKGCRIKVKPVGLKAEQEIYTFCRAASNPGQSSDIRCSPDTVPSWTLFGDLRHGFGILLLQAGI